MKEKEGNGNNVLHMHRKHLLEGRLRWGEVFVIYCSSLQRDAKDLWLGISPEQL